MRYAGFVEFGFTTQVLENPHLRNALGLSPQQTGVLVNFVEPTAPAFGHLQKDGAKFHLFVTEIRVYT
jgi:hypothetical protein